MTQCQSKRFLRLSKGVVVLLLLVLVFNVLCFANGRSERIKTKADLAKRNIEQWVQAGRNPSAAVLLMKQAKVAFDKNQLDEGEALIDKALAHLRTSPQTSAASSPYSPSQPYAPSHLYAHPEPVEIVGYHEDAMEPCITLDGQYLFFNGSNAGDVPMHIHCAKRLTDRKFQYLGMLPGVQSAHRDAAPSVDSAGNFYFTRVTDYPRTLRSIWSGKWAPVQVSGVASVGGDLADGCRIEPHAGPTVILNMDCGVSPRGQTLIVSRAKITHGAQAPSESDLFIATRGLDGSFNISRNSDLILKHINTKALEYAPALSSDELELYYTQARPGEQFANPNGDSSLFQTLVATRKDTRSPFGPPRRLTAVEGYAEAPSLTLDKRELYFHKKVGKLFRIFRVIRA